MHVTELREEPKTVSKQGRGQVGAHCAGGPLVWPLLHLARAIGVGWKRRSQRPPWVGLRVQELRQRERVWWLRQEYR